MEFLKKYKIKIKDKELLNMALTHSSYANENNVSDYERLEFLGDAILQIIMSEYFYLNTDHFEGEMTKIRASFVCETALAEYSKSIGVAPYVKLGEGQKSDLNDTILADVFESILGAIYLSNGYNDAKKLIYEVVIPYVKDNKKFISDYKSLLQEEIQTSKKTLEYITINEKGPAHDKTFTIEVRIDNIIYGRGVGKSKKEAEQAAAYDAYKKRARMRE